MPKSVVRAAALLLVVCATGWSHARLPNQTRADLGEDFVPAPHVVDVASLGFDALLADYYWLQAVQVAGAADVIREDTASHLGRLVDVVTTLNPHVDHPYRFAAVWLNHSREQVLEANGLLERAIAHHPEDWRNYFYLGFNHFYYLGDFAAAAEALEAAVLRPGSPAYLPRLVARLKSEQGDIDVAAVFLRQLMQETDDEAEIARLASALDEIEIESKARHLDRARAAFRQLVGRDIESVDELVRPPHRMLEKLPNPEPDALPEPLRRGSRWILDREGRIVSTYLGSRYEVHYASGRRAVFAAADEAAHDGVSDRASDEANEGANEEATDAAEGGGRTSRSADAGGRS